MLPARAFFMKNLKKVAKMSRLAFLNALRLHSDSIFLYKKKSYPSSFLLAVLAQEELGKTFLLEDHVYRTRTSEKTDELDLEYGKLFLEGLKSHKIKQGRFSREADDVWKYRGNRYPREVREISSGALDERKQNATYVGLTKDGKKINLKGRVINPVTKIKSKDCESYITRLNDYIIELSEGCRRGIYTVDTEELDSELTLNLVSELESLWAKKSKDSVNKLNKIRKFSIEK